MEKQHYGNHTRLSVPYHFIAYPLMMWLLVIAIRNFIGKVNNHYELRDALMFLIISIILPIVAFFARSFALKAQDRAIKAEVSLRYFIASGKQIDPALTMGQIIALRFAGDHEFLALADRAVKEKMSRAEIKKAITDWKADHHRV